MFDPSWVGAGVGWIVGAGVVVGFFVGMLIGGVVVVVVVVVLELEPDDAGAGVGVGVAGDVAVALNAFELSPSWNVIVLLEERFAE